MEELEPCRVAEIGVVRMSAQEFVGVRSVLEGEIGGKVPEATLNPGQQKPRIGLNQCIYHSGCV